MNNKTTAKEFWEKQDDYPDYPFIKERRLHELNYLVPKLEGMGSVLDLGCGDGALIKCLHELTDVKEYHAYDYSASLLARVPDSLPDASISKKQYDCYSGDSLPNAAVTVMGGLIQYIFEDEAVINLLKKISSPRVYVRTACTDKLHDDEVSTYSDTLKSQYSSLYRTVDNTRALLETRFDVDDVIRIYPDEIESKFGTKQYYFACSQY